MFKSSSLELRGVGKYRAISSAVEAARCRTEYWPKDKQQSDAFTAALLAC